MKNVASFLIFLVLVWLAWQILKAVIGFALSLVLNVLIIVVLALVAMALYKYVTNTKKV